MKRISVLIALSLASVSCATTTGPVGGNVPMDTQSAPSFTGSMKGMLESHNQARSRKNLPSLQWSSELASYAQDWANHLAHNNGCQMQHRSAAGMDHRKSGENLFWVSATNWSDGRVEAQQVTAPEVVQSWVEEEADYNYVSNRCRPGKQCGHYTQVVWRDTTHVGCGAALCPDSGQIWACNYDPPGNWVGQKPY